MNINSIQNGQKLSNKTAKAGALAGFVGSAAYLLKNKEDIFTKNIKKATLKKVDYLKENFNIVIEENLDRVKSLKLLDPKTKALIFGIPAAFVAGAVLLSAIAGKTAGVVAEKVQAKKVSNDSTEDETQATSNVSFKGTTTESGVKIPLYLDKADHSIEYSGFNKAQDDIYADRRNCQKAVNPFVVNATETRYIDGMPEEANFPLFVSDGDCEMEFINYDKLAECKKAYGNAFDVHCEANAEVAD